MHMSVACFLVFITTIAVAVYQEDKQPLITIDPIDCPKGVKYHGTVSTTVSGKTCQRWDSQSPHTHDRDEMIERIWGNVADEANYCRNPDWSNTTWCYTTDPNKEHEMCDVPINCD